MNQTPINENKFDFHRRYYSEEYYEIFSIIVKCYNLIKDNNYQLENNENKIRDFIYKSYLIDNDFKNNYNFLNYIVNKEPDENDGNVDLKFENSDTFKDAKAYFIIECKRLDCKNPNGKYGLNHYYIKEGVCRFTTEKYSSYKNSAGMLAFVVDDLDIDKNIINLNNKLEEIKESNTINPIKHFSFIDNYKYTYISKHETNNDKRQFDIYHLMLDLSKNIDSKKTISSIATK